MKYELSSRITSYHIIKSKYSKQNIDLLAGNIPLSSRNLNFICNDYIRTFNKKDSIESWLYTILDNYYWRSFIDFNSENKKKYIEESYQILKKEQENKYIMNENIKIEEEFKDIVDDLCGIQNYASKNIVYNEFNFKNFVEKCYTIVPLNKEKIQWLLNNIEDTLNILDNNINMDNELKSKFYQIITIKKIYEEIINKFDKIDGFVNEIKLSSEQLLSISEIKQILLKFKLLNYFLLQKENLYEINLNYLLFNPICQELCQKLYELTQEKSKEIFIQLVLFIFKNDVCFQILELLYPFNNEEINKNVELEFCSYYIYLWINLYKNKNNFTVRIGNEEYNIKFDDPQDKKIYCYFILNEKKSTLLSAGSYIGMQKNKNKNKYKKAFIKEISQEGTKYLLSIIIQNYNIIYKEKQITEYDKNFYKLKRFESLNFYHSKLSSLIPRIWPILFNFGNNKYFINYLEKNFIYLEGDTIKNLFKLYNNISNEKSIEKIIKKMKEIFFFGSNLSMLWKYRFIINEENINIPECENDIIQCEKEIKKLKILKDIWDMNEINKYENILNEINMKLILQKKRDKESKQVVELRKKTQELLNKMKQTKDFYDKDLKNNNQFEEIKKKKKKKKKNREIQNTKEINTEEKKIVNFNSIYIKQMNYISEEIIKFLKSENPTEKVFTILEKYVNDFLEITKEKIFLNEDLMELPLSNNYLANNNYKKNKQIKIEDLILWYSKIKYILNKMINENISDKKFMEYSIKLNDDIELDSIINYINEKKWEINYNNSNYKHLLYNDELIINNMLRSIILYKICSETLDLETFINFNENINKQINPIEVGEDDYIFANSIANKYPFNLKILFPKFEVKDVLYLFFKYNNNSFSKNNIINNIQIDKNTINTIANDILREI